MVLACERGPEGILTACAVGYLAHADEGRLRIAYANSLQQRLDEAIVEVDEDADLALRLHRGLERSISSGCPNARGGRCPRGCSGTGWGATRVCSRHVVQACACDGDAVPEVVGRFVRVAFAQGARITTMTWDPAVSAFEDLAHRASSETEHMRQFARFSRMSDGTLLAVVHPNADVVPFLLRHFASRLGGERFCIIDPAHRHAAFGDGGHEGVISLSEEDCLLVASRDDLSSDERYVRAMWKRFYDGLALPNRGPEQRGYDLRRQFMPKRLWDGLPEFDPTLDSYSGPVPHRYSNTPVTGSGTPSFDEVPLEARLVGKIEASRGLPG